MKNQPTFVHSKRKYLFLADEQGMTLLNPIIEQAKINNDPVEVVFLDKQNDFQHADIAHWLSQQMMGTYLYVSLPWKELNSIKRKIKEVGFSEEEYQCFGYGEKTKNVFCCRCHGITEAANEEVEIACPHCQLLLEVSDHYSSLRDAVLGYVAKL
jgi:dimethylamine monooxygenase subunit C